MEDVIVVGGGPAGACAAWKLAQAGMTVRVLEKAALPRYKVCGGGLVSRTMRLVPIDVHQVVEETCYQARLHFFSSGLSFVTQRTTPLVSMTMRAELDHALLSAAQAKGATVCDRCGVEGVFCHEDSITVATTNGPMRARFVIAADGALSKVARSVQWEDGRRLVPALEYEVAVPAGLLHQFEGMARFDFDIVQAGYGWVFPKRNHLSIGVLSMTANRHELRTAIGRYFDVLGCASPLSVERHGFVLPLSPRTGSFARRRILLTGDAAGFADPVTGEGISSAVRSGLLAAQSLIDGQLQQAVVEERYNRLVAQAVLPELRAGRLLAYILYHCPRVRTWVFSQQGQRLCEIMADIMAGKKLYQDFFRPRWLGHVSTLPWLSR
jgi:geranylgeranyl reductase family protein